MRMRVIGLLAIGLVAASAGPAFAQTSEHFRVGEIEFEMPMPPDFCEEGHVPDAVRSAEDRDVHNRELLYVERCGPKNGELAEFAILSTSRALESETVTRA